MNGRQIEKDTEADYLGATTTSYGTTASASVKRIRDAVATLCISKRKQIHNGKVAIKDLVVLGNSLVLPKADYELPLTPMRAAITEEWKDVEKIIMVNMIVCFSEKNKSRLRTVGRW